MSQRVDKKNLKRFAENIKTNANILKRETSYIAGQVVNKGQIVLKCSVFGTTDKEALDLTNVAKGSVLQDGTVEWKVISIFGYGSGGGAGSGSSVTVWNQSVEYEVGDIVIYAESLYRCNLAHTSDTDFSTDVAKWTLLYSDLKNWSPSTYYTVGVVVVNASKLYKCITTHTSDSNDFLADIVYWEPIGGGKLEEWEPNKDYLASDLFVYDGEIYKCLVGFTSGNTFNNIEILEDYTLAGETPILWADGTEININDIVEYNGQYYKAKIDFTCGANFTKEALELYIPKPLTETQIEEIIRRFNPVQSGTTGFVVENNAGAHNALYREKDLTDYFRSGQMSIAIADGSFRDIFPGDYIIMSIIVNGTTYADIKYIVGTLDYFLHNGDVECTTHHLLMFPEVCIGTAQMNTSNTSSGGYVGSRMWTTIIPQYVTAIRNAFGTEHVLTHRELLTTSMDTNGRSSAYCTRDGATNNWAWQDVTVNLFNENMVYGGAQCSSSMYDTGDGNHQVQAMRHNRQVMFTRSNWYWLRSVGTFTYFAYCDSNGNASGIAASRVGGVRPYFLLT